MRPTERAQDDRHQGEAGRRYPGTGLGESDFIMRRKGELLAFNAVLKKSKSVNVST